MDDLDHVFYVSRAKIDPCGAEPRRILDVATSRNARLKITGVLFYSGEHFAQVLEGPRQPLAEVMDSIRNDARHDMLVEWPQRPYNGVRWFSTWGMAYVFDERLDALLGRLSRMVPPLPPLEPLARELLAGIDLFQAFDNAEKAPGNAC